MKVLATSGSLEGIFNLVREYFHSCTELSKENDKTWHILNSKGRLLNFKVILKKGRYKFVCLPETTL